MRLHRCYENGCRELVPLNHRWCDKHYQIRHQAYLNKQEALKADEQHQQFKKRSDKKYDTTFRDQGRTSFYHSPQWQRVSSYIKQRDFYTDAITGEIVPDNQLLVDHVVPMRLCMTFQDKLNQDNLWCLSRKTHNIKTKIEQSMDDTKLRHLDKAWWTKVLKERLHN